MSVAEIEFAGVVKRFGRTPVLHGVDLAVDRGDFAVILGPSGCGKSTLLRLLAGLETVTEGAVRLAGRVLNDVPARDRDVAMVFQNYALYPHMSVAENLGYSLKVAGVARAERAERVQAVAKTLQIDHLLDRRPGQLSGGQRQRVAMGRAIIRRPRAFLFDEPLSNLDAKLRTQMRLEIKSLHRRQGVTSLFVTHDQIEAITLADLLVVMNEGRIEQIGRPRAVYDAPASAFVATFIGAPAMNLAPGVLGGGGRWVDLGEGLRVPLDSPPAVADGEAVQVGVRPEHVQIDRVGGCPLPVELVEELGNGRLAHLRLNGASLSVLVPATDEAGIGERVGVRLPPERLHFFDTRTGAALPRLARPTAATAPATARAV
jgi:sn-glycerol 3-phosphate transport system ATP-binding protein